jgi:Mg-chelatase subunit ChlI
MPGQMLANALSLKESGYRPRMAQESLSESILSAIEGLRSKGYSREESLSMLFQTTIVDQDVLERLFSAIISGTHILLFGPSGTGKTSIAKELWRLFPKDIHAVQGCPVQDDPMSVIDRAFNARSPCCPSCWARFGSGVDVFDPSLADPAEVPVIRTRLREGYGLSRVQGSSEVFPDNLTGVFNLHKLEQIGDPTSPLILEPGKLLQANRGLLMVDEVGKLPLGTQNVLLQALQEGIVTPAKSRETFPASFVAVTTSNLRDLDAINEPLNDRLTNIYVDYIKDHAKNRRILEVARRREDMRVFMPEIYIHASIFIVESWRDIGVDVPELSEVGSNRAILDTISRSMAYAQLRGSRMVSREDLEKGIRDALFGRIRARGGDSFQRNEEILREFLTGNLELSLERAFRIYWCTFFQRDLGGNVPRAERLARSIQSGSVQSGGDGDLLRAFIAKNENASSGIPAVEIERAIVGIMNAMKDFGCK